MDWTTLQKDCQLVFDVEIRGAFIVPFTSPKATVIARVLRDRYLRSAQLPDISVQAMNPFMVRRGGGGSRLGVAGAGCGKGGWACVCVCVQQPTHASPALQLLPASTRQPHTTHTHTSPPSLPHRLQYLSYDKLDAADALSDAQDEAAAASGATGSAAVGGRRRLASRDLLQIEKSGAELRIVVATSSVRTDSEMATFEEGVESGRMARDFTLAGGRGCGVWVGGGCACGVGGLSFADVPTPWRRPLPRPLRVKLARLLGGRLPLPLLCLTCPLLPPPTPQASTRRT